jgi:hypothetical protein
MERGDEIEHYGNCIMMTPRQLSILSWVGGGILGSALSKQHRVAGFIAGAIGVGAVADVVIERHHPWYTGIRPRKELP